MLDVVALQAGDFIEQAAGSALLQNLPRSRPGVETALGDRFVQNPGEPGFGVGVIWPVLTVKEVGDAQSAARRRFNHDPADHATAQLFDFERTAVGDAFDLRIIIVEFDLSANRHYERVAFLVVVPHPHTAPLRYRIAVLFYGYASRFGRSPAIRRLRHRASKNQNQSESNQHSSSISLKQIRLLFRDARVERLELEPAGEHGADLLAGQFSVLVINQTQFAGGLGQQLRLATALHRNEPPGGLINRSADGQQSVVAQDDGFVLAERGGDALAFDRVVNHSRVIVEDAMVFIERTGVLSDRIERARQGRPRFAVHRMRVGGRHTIGARRVNRRVDGEGGDVDRGAALDDLAFMVDQDQVGDPNLAEIHAERVDPEMVMFFRVARRDVPRDAFVEPEFGEEAQGGGQPLFPMQPLFLDRFEIRRHRQIERLRWVDHRFFWHMFLLRKSVGQAGGSYWQSTAPSRR